MFPPSGGYNLDIDAISGICGSVSIACWIVVYSPQIIENFRRSSADALSIEFVIIWTAGDVFNMLGAVLQKVLPTMIILAVYYTFADIVLLGQCFYYKGFRFRDPEPDNAGQNCRARPTERSALLGADDEDEDEEQQAPRFERTRSASSFRQRLANDGAYLSPATPMHPSKNPDDTTSPLKPSQPRSLLQKILFNLTAVILVFVAGVAGYYLSPAAKQPSDREAVADQDETLTFSIWGQIFGYFCAALYLGSRVPQLLLNYRRKSTEGLNALFFLFACIGNITYVMSIFAFSPICHGNHGQCEPGEAPSIYGRYILVNLSWLIGSLGTFFLDMGVFVQFWLYRKDDLNEDEVFLGTDGNPIVPDDTPRIENGEGRGRALNER